jgi:hypothetical protein
MKGQFDGLQIRKSAYNIRAINVIENVHDPKNRHQVKINLPSKSLLGICVWNVVPQRRLEFDLFSGQSMLWRDVVQLDMSDPFLGVFHVHCCTWRLLVVLIAGGKVVGISESSLQMSQKRPFHDFIS